MSLDAMDWVWTRSTAKGTSRLVLLAIADKATGPRCTAYAGTTMLIKHTNASRSSVVTSVDKLLASGELAVIENTRGPLGATVYQLPGAVGHIRKTPGKPGFGGSESGPVKNPDRSENETPRGPESGPEGYRIRTGRGMKSGPQNQREPKHQEEQQQPRASAPSMPEQLQPLAAALDAVGVMVRWNLSPHQQHDLVQLLRRHSVEALVELAAWRRTSGGAPKPASYWLAVWSDLDWAPAVTPHGSSVVPLRERAVQTTHTDNLAAGLALLEREGTA
ncbi:hypothetical protein [Streptomyces luteireticuli]|uniref:hypothetical protein n=1 Tax=Streptomyces luteireticuli TaxID=173858 RepID=UPI0035562403